jgi:hydrogenase-4 component F
MSAVLLTILLPLAAALAAWLIPSNSRRPWLLPVVACLHLPLAVSASMTAGGPALNRWIDLDAIGSIFLLEFSVLFTACSFYAVDYLQYRRERDNRILCSGLLACLAAMSLSAATHHLGLLWLAIETTTLVMAPMVYFNHNARSIEATWKYMLICSVGIALALLGIYFLAYSTIAAGLSPSLQLATLLGYAPQLPQVWLQSAFVFMLVGYGTKMGLAPMHSWKPDAYGEAPGIVGAMMAGGLANCGFLGLIRIYQICIASGDQSFCKPVLIGAGLFSIALAAVFLIRQSDFKRMLAYSSVEHMGLFVLALGLGGKALYGAMLHVIANGLGKGVLFLIAGNIHRAFASKNVQAAHGTLKRAPWSGVIFLLGFFSLTGSPPFATFFSEFAIFSAAISQGHLPIAVSLALLLSTAFLGMALTVFKVVFGEPSNTRERTRYKDTILLIAPPLSLLILLALIGVLLPQPLSDLLYSAAALLEYSP